MDSLQQIRSCEASYVSDDIDEVSWPVCGFDASVATNAQQVRLCVNAGCGINQ
jgi:hypothetical protein